MGAKADTRVESIILDSTNFCNQLAIFEAKSIVGNDNEGNHDTTAINPLKHSVWPIFLFSPISCGARWYGLLGEETAYGRK